MSPSKLSLLLALVLGVSLHSGAAFYDTSSGVIILDNNNFDQQVIESRLPFFAEFYAPWCVHCKNMKSQWEKLAKKLEGKVRVGAIDLNTDENLPVASRYDVKGFPTFKLFVGGSPIDYNGERTASAMEKFALRHIPSRVTKVTTSSLNDFLSSSPEVPKGLLFSKKKSTTALYKALSVAFEGRMQFGEVHKTESKVMDQFGISEYPSFMAFPAPVSSEDPSGVLFQGKITPKAIQAFIKRFALPGDDDEVVPHIQDNSCLKHLCTDRGGVCVWLLTTPNDEDKNKFYLGILSEAAEQADRTYFHFGYIDGAVQGEFIDKAFGLSLDFPRLVAFSASKKRFATFLGSFSAENVADFLRGVLSGRVKTQPLQGEMPALEGDTEKCKPSPKPKVEAPKKPNKPKPSPPTVNFSVELTQSNFNKLVLKSSAAWMVEFMAPWCGHCQQLAPQWAKAANKLKGIVKFGVVDCTQHQGLATRYSVKGFPTVKAFPLGKKGAANDYQGARTSKALAAFAVGMLSNNAKAVKPGNVEKWSQSGAKALFVTSKVSTPALVKALSSEFKRKIEFGTVVASDQVLSQLGLESAPALLLFSNGERSDYSGHLLADPVRKHLKKWASKAGPGQATSEAPEAAKEDSVELVPLLKTQADFDRDCAGKLGVCVLTLVKPAMDGVDEALKTIGDVAAVAATRSMPFHFVQVDRSQRNQLDEAFSLAEDESVAVVALHAKKRRYSRFVGGINEESLLEFLERLTQGKQSTKPLPDLPSLGDGDAPAAAGGEGQCSGDADQGVCTEPRPDEPVASVKDEL